MECKNLIATLCRNNFPISAYLLATYYKAQRLAWETCTDDIRSMLVYADGRMRVIQKLHKAMPVRYNLDW